MQQGESEEAARNERSAWDDYMRKRHSPWSEEDLAELTARLRDVEPQIRLAMREEREGLGWSQARLAAELQKIGMRLDPTAITRIESGKRSIRADEAWAIAAALRLSLDELIPTLTSTRSLEERLEFEKRSLEIRKRQLELAAEEVTDLESEIAKLEQQLEEETRNG